MIVVDLELIIPMGDESFSTAFPSPISNANTSDVSQQIVCRHCSLGRDGVLFEEVSVDLLSIRLLLVLANDCLASVSQHNLVQMECMKVWCKSNSSESSGVVGL